MINWDIIKSPVNWAIVVLMLLIGGIALDSIATHYQSLSSSNKDA